MAIGAVGRERVDKFEHADDFRNRAAWRDEVDVVATAPERIVGWYSFPQMYYVQCGLASCRRSHGLGFLVLLADGTETNIGGHCGRKHVEKAVWSNIFKTFTATQKTQSQLEVIGRVLARKDETLAKARALLERVIPAATSVQRIVAEVYKDKGLQRAFDDARKSGGDLIYYRHATERERELNPRAQTVPVRVGRLDGNAAHAGSTVIQELRYKVIAHLEDLEPDGMVAMKAKELDRYTKFIGDMDPIIRRAGYFLDDAARFIRRQNWDAFETFCRDSGMEITSKALTAFAAINIAVSEPAPDWTQ